MGPDDIRRIALSFPEAVEAAHMGHPDFRVCGKIFAGLFPAKGIATAKLPPEIQDVLLREQPDVFKPAAGAWGRQGWTEIKLAAADGETLKRALATAWRLTAPKRLAAAHPDV